MTTPPPGAQTWPDDVEGDQISQRGLDGYARAREQLAHFQVPQLVGANKPHRRMFVATRWHGTFMFSGQANRIDSLQAAS